MTVSVSLRLPEDLVKALDRLSGKTERSRTYLMRKALEVYLSEVVDYQIALDRLRDKDDPVISSSEMRRRLGV